MKLKRYLKWMLGAATLLSGCADDDFIDRNQSWDGTIPDELTLTLTIPDPEIVSLGGTRGENGPINTVTLMQYDAKGQHLGNIKYSELEIKRVPNSNAEWTLTATLNKESKSIQVVANYDVAETDTDPSKLITDKDYLLPYTDSESGPVLWADVDLGTLLADNSYEPQIALERQAAKLSVEVKDDADFELTGFMVYGMAEKGCVAPNADNLAAGDPTIPADVKGSYNTGWIDPDKFGYFFETAAEEATSNPHARIIIKGNYEGKEYYYVAAFRSRTPEVKDKPTETPGAYSYKGIPALRNHWYKLSVEKVRGAGWNSEDEAQTAMPDNRATIELTDMTESISDMIATRDYMLGVSGDVTTDWNTPATVTVVTSYASSIDAAAQKKLPVKFSTETSWIQLTEAQQEGVVIGNNTRDFEITLAPNSLSTDDRSGEITVTLGKLTRTIKVTQTGRPLRRERHAIVVGLPGVTATEAGGIRYYEWIDGSNATESAPQGMKDSENRGENRNDALIFTAVPAYELYYKIPVESGDTYKLSSEADFTVKEEGGYYIIKAKTTDKPNIAKAELTITNKDGAEIKYDLLQVGYFHKLDGQHQAAAAGVKSGWFYYEVVHFRGGYPDGMYVLDRNLGASTNASYDPTSISYTSEDDAAIGGYFKVNTGRPAEADRKGLYDHKTITDQIGMTYAGGRFIVMSENELKGMGLPSNKNFGAGAISLAFDEGEVAGGNVYIPAAGYYYGTTYRNASHVNLWTRTLLGGTQGLTESDDEYGVNYRILDIFGGRVNYSGLRMGSGSGLTVKENLMRYLPLRLIWRGADDSMDASDVEDSSGTIGTGENVTIWVKNSAGWSNMNIYAWISDDNRMSSWPGTPMQKATHNGESNWYKLEIDKQWKSLIFNNGSDKTGDIINYRNGHNDATEFEFEVKSSKTENCNNYDFLGTGGGGGDTPTERTAITIMLRNDANWGVGGTFSDFGILFYDSNGNQVSSKYVFGENNKVTYKNENWIKVELSNYAVQQEIDALNKGGWIVFYNGSSTSPKLTDISTNTSYGAFFYSNSSNYSLISKQASATVNTTPGWISSENARYRIYWKYNSQSFVGLNVFTGSSESIVNTLYNNWPNEQRDAKYSFNQYSANKDYAYVEFSHSKFDSNTSLTAEPRLSGTNNYGGDSRKTPIKVSDWVLVDGVYCYTISGEGGSGNGGVPSGSGSTGGDDASLPAIPSGKARVVVYNESWWTGGVMEFEYQYSGGQTKANMNQVTANNQTFFYLDIEPGMSQFHLQREKPSWQWTSWFTTGGITAGNTYYYSVSSSGALSTSTKKHAPRRAIRRR